MPGEAQVSPVNTNYTYYEWVGTLLTETLLIISYLWRALYYEMINVIAPYITSQRNSAQLNSIKICAFAAFHMLWRILKLDTKRDQIWINKWLINRNDWGQNFCKKKYMYI